MSTVVACLVLSACGNWVTTEVSGRTAVGVRDDGSAFLLVAPCGAAYDEIHVSGDRQGLDPDEENPQVGSWTLETPLEETFEIDLGGVPAGWEGSPRSVHIDADHGYIADASSSSVDVQTSQVYFRGRQLSSLSVDEVLVGNRQVWTRKRFEADACK